MKFRIISYHFSIYLLLFFLTPFLFSSSAGAADLPQFHTIQAGSYSQEPPASRLLYSLAESLAPGQRDYLRVEKVGGYYTVRLGRFGSWSEADQFLGAAGEPLAGALILQAHNKPERISLLYEPVVQGEASRPRIQDTAPVPTKSENDILPVSPEKETAAEIIADLDGPFETVAEGGQAGAAAMGDGAQPNKADDAAVSTAAVVGRQETAALQDLEDAGEDPDGPGADIFDQGEKFAKRGQPSGLSPVRVVKVFSRDIYDRKISFPREVHYDPFMDEIYMLSSGGQVNTRVTVYGQDYFPVAALGPGRGISNPMGMTVDKLGNIYVAQGETSDDAGTRIAPMVRVLNAAFFKVRDIFFAEIPGIGGNFVPQNMALGPDNDTLYISGNGVKGVLVLDLEGNFKRWLIPLKVGGVSEEMGNDPSHPGALKVEDVVVDARGRIYILANIAGRIYVLDRDENFLFAFGELGGSTGKLSNPRSIAVDVHREVIYVVDYMRHAINAYTYKDGRYLLEFGGQGLSEGWFQFPSHIAVDRRGNVIVADMFNHRVQVMDVP